MEEHEKTIQIKQDGIAQKIDAVNALKEQQIQMQKEIELQKVELGELRTFNSTLKNKLGDA